MVEVKRDLDLPPAAADISQRWNATLDAMRSGRTSAGQQAGPHPLADQERQALAQLVCSMVENYVQCGVLTCYDVSYFVEITSIRETADEEHGLLAGDVEVRISDSWRADEPGALQYFAYALLRAGRARRLTREEVRRCREIKRSSESFRADSLESACTPPEQHGERDDDSDDSSNSDETWRPPRSRAATSGRSSLPVTRSRSKTAGSTSQGLQWFYRRRRV